MNGCATMMDREKRTRIENAVGLATVAPLYLLNWLTGNL